MTITNFKMWSLFFVISLLLPITALALPLSEESDFDNDGLGDIVYYDPSNALFMIRGSSNAGFTQISLGSIGDSGATGDFDGDGRADLATYNRSTARYNVLLQGAASSSSQGLGSVGDVPVPGSYTDLGCTDLATFNIQTSTFTIRSCENGATSTVQVGDQGSLPAPADFDCDGLVDPATFNRNERRWTIRRSSDNRVQSFVYGLWFDMPIPGNFTSTTCAQPAFYRPLGKFFIYGDTIRGSQSSPSSATLMQWGLSEDRFALVDADGDSRVDFSVTRSTNGTNYLNSSLGFFFPVPIGADSGDTTSVTRITPPFTGGLPRYTSFNVPTSATTASQPLYNVKGDYNRDGRADFVVATVDAANNRTTFRALLNTGQDASFEINSAADAFVPGDYNGDGRTQPAVVKVNTSNSQLEWTILNPDGTETVEIFGSNGSNPIVGDFDCDGKDDKALTRVENGFLMWDIDISSNDGQIITRNFGLAGDNPYVADINGNLCDDLVVSRELGGGITWYTQSLEDGTPQGPINFESVQWGLVGDTLNTPSDMDGDGLADIMVSRPTAGGGIDTYIRKTTEGPNPAPVPTPFGLHCDIVAAGQYDGLNFGKLAVYRRSEGAFFVDRFFGAFDVVNHGSGNEIVIRPDGTVAGSTNDFVAPVGTVCPTGDASSPIVTPPTSGPIDIGGCSITQDFQDGAGGALWKPHSERTGTVVILMPPNYRFAEVDVLNNAGQSVASPQLRDCCSHNGGREHVYLTQTAGALAGQGTPLTVKFAFADGFVDCRTVPNPNQRYD